LIAARGDHDVCLWTRDPQLAEFINRTHTSPRLADEEILPNVIAESDLRPALDGADMVILCSPSHVMRGLLTVAAPLLDRDSILVSATKGIEDGTLMRMSQVAADVLGSDISSRFVVLSGPSFAREVAANHPTTVVAASSNAEAAAVVQSTLSIGNFRVYTNDDVVGVELGGAVKNVIAIAAGMVSGLGFGHNTVAALITRGLAEINRLGAAFGARPETLSGLAGLGDLVLTCTGDLSRNRHVGYELGRGRKLGEITSGMREIAEGVRTAPAVNHLAVKNEVDMPITWEVFWVVHYEKSPRVAMQMLMGRPLRAELDKEAD
jgi:glycerol-3-phosphate dehydrogenase (NAD(P)+)